MRSLTKEHSTKKMVLAIAISAMAAAAIGFAGLTGCSSNSSSSSSSASSSATTAKADAKYENLPETTLIAADNAAKGAAATVWTQKFADKVGEITGGKLKVEYHGSGELGGDADLLRQEQSNDIQIVVTQPAPIVSFVPGVAAFDLPMAFKGYNAKQIDAVLNGKNTFSKDMQADFEKAGFHDLGWLQSATYRETTSNKKLDALSDFKGFQIRTMENKNHMNFWTAIGSEPTPLAFSEVYFALQNGTVDGQENATDTCLNSSFQEVQKYLCMTDHILYVNEMSINNDCWKSLDPAYQDAINQAVKEATAEVAPTLVKADKDSIKAMEKAGVKVIKYDDGFTQEVLSKDGVKKLYKDISKQTDGLSDELVKALKAEKK